MVYVKDNVERIVSNIVDAKKLEADGFKRIDKPKIDPATNHPVDESPVAEAHRIDDGAEVRKEAVPEKKKPGRKPAKVER